MTSTLLRMAAILLAGIVVVVFIQNKDALSIDSLIDREEGLRRAVEEHPFTILASAFALYVAMASLPLPGAALLTIVYGWLFGFWRAVLLVSFASTLGATVAFLMSRFLFRDTIQYRLRDRLTGVNTALERDGSFYLFTLRLMPQIPFFLVNLLMGLTTIRTVTFWWISQLGMLPGTCLYVYTGASLANLELLRKQGPSGILTWQVVIAFLLLGLFPWIVNRLMRLLTNQPAPPTIN